MSLRSLIVLGAVALSTTASACGGKRPIPSWHGRLFFGDSDRGGLSRGGIDPDFLPVGDRLRFDDMVCMSRPDFKSWNDTYIGGCKEWKGRKGTVVVQSPVWFELISGRRRFEDLGPQDYEVLE